jgi:MOSC domain-containing protein YiiM
VAARSGKLNRFQEKKRMQQATIAGIAVRTSRRGAMQTIDEASAVPRGGLAEDIPVSRQRGITLLSRSAWAAAIAELGVELPWYTRRANVLVDDLALAETIGKTLRVGEVVLKIHAETEPCQMMDEQHLGLRNALEPECRAGVYGEVLVGGRLRIGDVVEVCDEVAVA